MGLTKKDYREVATRLEEANDVHATFYNARHTDAHADMGVLTITPAVEGLHGTNINIGIRTDYDNVKLVGDLAVALLDALNGHTVDTTVNALQEMMDEWGKAPGTGSQRHANRLATLVERFMGNVHARKTGLLVTVPEAGRAVKIDDARVHPKKVGNNAARILRLRKALAAYVDDDFRMGGTTRRAEDHNKRLDEGLGALGREGEK